MYICFVGCASSSKKKSPCAVRDCKRRATRLLDLRAPATVRSQMLLKVIRSGATWGHCNSASCKVLYRPHFYQEMVIGGSLAAMRIEHKTLVPMLAIQPLRLPTARYIEFLPHFIVPGSSVRWPGPFTFPYGSIISIIFYFFMRF